MKLLHPSLVAQIKLQTQIDEIDPALRTLFEQISEEYKKHDEMNEKTFKLVTQAVEEFSRPMIFSKVA
jgi:hypothetical protein